MGFMVITVVQARAVIMLLLGLLRVIRICFDSSLLILRRKESKNC